MAFESLLQIAERLESHRFGEDADADEQIEKELTSIARQVGVEFRDFAELRGGEAAFAGLASSREPLTDAIRQEAVVIHIETATGNTDADEAGMQAGAALSALREVEERFPQVVVVVMTTMITMHRTIGPVNFDPAPDRFAIGEVRETEDTETGLGRVLRTEKAGTSAAELIELKDAAPGAIMKPLRAMYHSGVASDKAAVVDLLSAGMSTEQRSGLYLLDIDMIGETIQQHYAAETGSLGKAVAAEDREATALGILAHAVDEAEEALQNRTSDSERIFGRMIGIIAAVGSELALEIARNGASEGYPDSDWAGDQAATVEAFLQTHADDIEYLERLYLDGQELTEAAGGDPEWVEEQETATARRSRQMETVAEDRAAETLKSAEAAVGDVQVDI